MSRKAIAPTVRREPKRATMWPEATSEVSEPAAMDSSTRPSRDGLRCNASRICGMRLAQLDIATPAVMNVM
jgi:hypothetical protein